jgi:hypothetical protein
VADQLPLLDARGERAFVRRRSLDRDFRGTPLRRENLANIREFWISLGTARPFLSESDFVKQAEAIGRFHANL